MVEQGFVKHLNSLIAPTFPNVSGGFLMILPENFVSKANPMSWTYQIVTTQPLYVLTGQNPLIETTIQVDCHGFEAVHAVKLARAVQKAMSGIWSGVFDDPDQTMVTAIFAEPTFVSGFNSDSRTYVTTLEYTVQHHA
jgi:hypothetical protein